MFDIYEKGMSSLSLQTTGRCNLDCDYCYYTDKKNRTMAHKTIDSALEAAFQSKGNSKNFIITGGEPLLDFDVFCYTVGRIAHKARKYSKKPRIVCPTNGTIMTNEIADYIQRKNVILSFSIDGDKETHDLFRKDRQGKGTFSAIMKSISALGKDYFSKNCFVSMTVHPKTVNKLIKNYVYIYRNINKNIDIYPCRFVDWKPIEKAKYERSTALIMSRMKTKKPGIENRGLYVDVSGNIFLCSLFTNKTLADREDMKIGSINAGKIKIKKRFLGKKIKSCTDICRNICKNFY